MSKKIPIPKSTTPDCYADIGASQVLDLPEVASSMEWIEKITLGLPAKSVETFARRYSLPVAAACEFLGISGTTLARRKKNGRLKRTESDCLYRIAALYATAENLFEDGSLAAQWMQKPNYSLGEIAPVVHAQTTIGMREVENLLGQITHGIAA